MAQAVFLPAQDGRFVATELARGPWDPDAQHGGAPAALLMRAFEALPRAPGLQVARVTYEFLRPVPLGELEVRAAAVRPGRRVQLLEASLLTPDGTEVTRARALQVQTADSSAAQEPRLDGPPAAGPEDGWTDAPPIGHGDLAFFGNDAMDIRFVAGGFSQPGPASAWFRLRVPLVKGEETSALQGLAAAADFGNGISAVVPWKGHLFINPDLTFYLGREPVGEWIGLEAHTRIAARGIGVAESVIYDEQGWVGRATQALLVQRTVRELEGSPAGAT
jgi:hypothetical protein